LAVRSGVALPLARPDAGAGAPASELQARSACSGEPRRAHAGCGAAQGAVSAPGRRAARHAARRAAASSIARGAAPAWDMRGSGGARLV
jgi:hypothetical protein